MNKINFSSNVAEHCSRNKHDANFSDPKIAYCGSNYSSRLFLESIQIEKFKFFNTDLMNDKLTGSTCIPQEYLSLL